MKKKTIIFLSVGLLLALVVAACVIDMYQMSNNKPVIFSTWGRKYAPPMQEQSITGVVIEVYDHSFLMHGEPTEGYPNAEEYSVSLNVENEDSYTSVAVGDEVIVYHNGEIAESDPLQINTVSTIKLKTPAPNDDKNDLTDRGKIVNIIDRTQNEDIAVDTALEMFYEDEATEYYFSGMMSEYILVEYENGSRKTVKEALEIGDITLEDLDRYNINYIVEAKSKSHEEQLVSSSIPADLYNDNAGDTTAETEKIPSISDVSQMNYNEINEVLSGKDIQEIREVWGEPTDSDDKKEVWQLDKFMRLVLTYNNTGIIESCELVSGTPLATAE